MEFLPWYKDKKKWMITFGGYARNVDEKEKEIYIGRRNEAHF